MIGRHNTTSRCKGTRSSKSKHLRMSSDTISLDDVSSDTQTSRTTSTMDCGSLDTILKQLEQERLRMERQRNRLWEASGQPPYDSHYTATVPLAEPEQFPDDGSVIPFQGRDGPVDSDHISSIECLSVDEDVFMCSPDASSEDTSRQETSRITPRLDLITDVNGNGTARSRGLLSRRCDQLETSDEESSGNEEETTTQQDYDMATFAEKYFNVHTSQTGGYGNAFTSIVRRRSLSVSTHKIVYYYYWTGQVGLAVGSWTCNLTNAGSIPDEFD